MPIKILLSQSPLIFCDVCGERIEAGADGQYKYQVDPDGRPVDGDIFFTHGRCSLPFESDRSGAPENYAGWQSGALDLFPLYLAAHLQVNWKASPEWCQWLAWLGDHERRLVA